MNVNIIVKFSNFCGHILLSIKNLSYLCHSVLYFTIIFIRSFTLYSAVCLRAETWLSPAFSLFLFDAYSFQKYTYEVHWKGNFISDTGHRLDCFQTRLSNWIYFRFPAKKRNIFNHLSLIQRTRLI